MASMETTVGGPDVKKVLANILAASHIQIKILKACTSCEVPIDVLVDTLNLAQYIRSQCLVVDHEETASDVSQCKMSSEEVDSAPPPPPTPPPATPAPPASSAPSSSIVKSSEGAGFDRILHKLLSPTRLEKEQEPAVVSASASSSFSASSSGGSSTSPFKTPPRRDDRDLAEEQLLSPIPTGSLLHATTPYTPPYTPSPRSKVKTPKSKAGLYSPLLIWAKKTGKSPSCIPPNKIDLRKSITLRIPSRTNSGEKSKS